MQFCGAAELVRHNWQLDSLMSNEVSAPTEVCPAGGAFHNYSSFIRLLVLGQIKNYTAVSSQGAMGCDFSYQTIYFQRKLWQYRLLPSDSFARVGFKITEIRKTKTHKHDSERLILFRNCGENRKKR